MLKKQNQEEDPKTAPKKVKPLPWYQRIDIKQKAIQLLVYLLITGVMAAFMFIVVKFGLKLV